MANRKFIYINGDFEYQEEAESVSSSSGAGDSGKLITLDASGKLDASFIPDSVTNNLDWKDSVRVASSADVSIATAPATIDGVTLANGDRVLLYGQTSGGGAADNGIYVFNGAGSAMTRAADADDDVEVTAGLSVISTEGTADANCWFILITNDPITVGTTGLSFAKQPTINSQGGDGINITGNVFSVDLAAADSGLEFVSGELSLDFADTSVAGDLDGSNGEKPIRAEDLSGNGSNQGANILGGDPSSIVNSSSTTIQGILEDLDSAIASAGENGVDYLVESGGSAVAKGDLVYISAAGAVQPLPITGAASSNWAIGCAATAQAAGSTVEVTADDVILTGVLSGATPGQLVFWDGSALTLTAPSGSGERVWIAGVAATASNLHVQIERVKRNF